ncbi:hypothetical protein RJ641_028875 [Dillenia turbinata]|uniref:Uncharacterized protein n=1 Tax=Dillenia turbinata TaxID=194707 RepID=A0AAN8ZFT0_9MAGN
MPSEDAKPVRKKEVKEEEAEDEDDKSLGPVRENRKKSASSNSKPPPKLKKEENDDHDFQPKKERKVYDLPGQKRDPPEERDPLRIFYETLYKQVPGCEMAAFWMMESGLLPKDEAKKVLEKKQKKSQQQNLSSPMKTVVSVRRSSDSVIIKKKTASSPDSTQKKKTDSRAPSKQPKKCRVEDSCSGEDFDDDFVLSKKPQKKQKI